MKNTSFKCLQDWRKEDHLLRHYQTYLVSPDPRHGMRLRLLRQGDAEAESSADVGDPFGLLPGYSRLEDDVKPEEVPHVLQTRSENDAGNTMHVRKGA